MNRTHVVLPFALASVILATSCTATDAGEDTAEASDALADPSAPCHAKAPTPDAQLEEKLDAELDALPSEEDVPDDVIARDELPADLARKAERTIHVVVHFILPESSARDREGWRRHARSYVARLNDRFARTTNQFRLRKVTRTFKDRWWSEGYTNARLKSRIERRLHRGSLETLNVYAANTGGGGVGSFPWDGTLADDGIWVPWNITDVIVHETGHWLGLFHTFQGGCEGRGDYVRDTGASLQTSGCGPYDTCPTRRRRDPVHNWMSYNCGTHFTRGQKRRMDYWARWRRDPDAVRTRGADFALAPLEAPYAADPSFPETEVDDVAE